jgi:hypothetical protein
MEKHRDITKNVILAQNHLISHGCDAPVIPSFSMETV